MPDLGLKSLGILCVAGLLLFPQKPIRTVIWSKAHSACKEAEAASILYTLTWILISFLQVHVKIISGFTSKYSKSPLPSMIGSTVPVRISRCHLRTWSAPETRGRTAKPADEINDPSSSAQQSCPVDLTWMYIHLFFEGRGSIFYCVFLNIILIEIWVKCTKNNECTTKKYCRGVIFDLNSLKIGKKTFLWAQQDFYSSHFCSLVLSEGQTAQKKH